MFRKKQKAKDFFPYRPMTLSEAIAIHGVCVELTAPGSPADVSLSWSKFPPGGYVAVVEAFARMYVHLCPKNDDQEKRDHFRSGLLMFADSAPDWISDLVGLKSQSYRDGDLGMMDAGRHASEFYSMCVSLQSEYGEPTFNDRVDELRVAEAV